MRIHECIACRNFPCQDVKHDRYNIPAVDLVPQQIRLVLISEAAPDDPADGYYASGTPSFAQTTLQAFNAAGAEVQSIQDLLDRGVYLTTAIKCGKTGYGIETATINECSKILEQELALFPNVCAFLLMGDVAIRAVNTIARRQGQVRVIPAGSTYKIRGGDFRFHGAQAFPSYLQVGPSFGIEKSKQRMITEDITLALQTIKIDR
jgi:uracil-DNA glycosylase